MRKILIWDNDGTITGSKDPNDTSSAAKIVLPNVKKVMEAEHTINVICTGTKTPESELQNFDPEKVIAGLQALMTKLPVWAATFSPAMGGTECWAILKHSDSEAFEVRKAHEQPAYKSLIGKFKKPDSGMLVVLKDLLREQNLVIDAESTLFIGDSQQDMEAAYKAGLPFVYANYVHTFGPSFKNYATCP